MLHKYYTLFQLSWQNGLVYRTSLLLWRFRQFLTSVMALTLWQFIFTNGSTILGYRSAEMTSYILLISLLQSLILASSLHGLAGEVYSGQITQNLLKPLRFFGLFFTLELADKLRNVAFSMLEVGLLYLVFKPDLVWPSLGVSVVFVGWCVLGALLHFYITILFGTLGFWSPNTWGPKFLFFMLLDFTAGRLFPLDILPMWVQKVLLLTPFPYLSYVQIQLFLNRLDSHQMWQYGGGLVMWTLLSWWLASWLWQKGIHNYEATGQ